MDRNRVLVRTDSGEAAMQQPTRLVQRNLRTALTLVDGKRSAGEIADQFADGSIGKSALADLERAGMITLVMVGKTDEVHEVQDAGAVETPIHSMGGAAVSLPSQVTEQHPGTAEAVIEVITLDDGIDPVPVRKPALGQGVRKRSQTSHHAHASAIAEIGSGAAELPAPASAGRQARRAASVSGRRGIRGTLLSVLAFVAVAAVLVAAIASRLYPYERHRPGLERELSETLGQPVRIGAISFAWMPLPAITLEHVAIGEDERLTVAAMRVVPDPRSVFHKEWLVYELQLQGVSVTGAALVTVSEWLSLAAKKRDYVLHHVSFGDGTLVLNDAVVNGFSGEWKMDDGGRPQALSFQRGDGAISGELTPGHGAYQLKLHGNGWKPDFLAPMVVDYFDSEGVVDSQST